MEARVYSPRKSPASTLFQTRAIKPSPEKRLAIKSVQISPKNPKKRAASSEDETGLTPRKRLFPHTKADPALDLTLDYPIDPTKHSPELIKTITSSSRIDFENFSLVEDGVARMPHSEEEFDLLSSAFPTATAVGVYPPMVVVRFKILPPKPWPLAVAGLPLFITTGEWDLGLKYGRPGGKAKALQDWDARYGRSKQMFEAAIQYFEKDLGVAITSILNLAGPWIITIPDDVKLSEVPGLLAKTPCTYKFVSEMEAPREAAFRNREPHGTVWDTSSYETLRPGIMLSSGGALTPELLTTSGIAVQDDQGSHYVTVASHGFPVGSEKVYHPNQNGLLLGTVYDRLTDADIALLRLPPGDSFQNETFGASTTDGVTLEGVRVTGLRDTFDMRAFDTVCMNNPFSGYREGLHIGAEMRKVPSDEPVAEHKWVTNQWSYIGNDMDEPMEGSCGSVVLDEDSKAVSFFRFVLASQPGFAVGIAASTLQSYGYSVV